MPVQTAKRSLATARNTIRRHWDSQESRRRREVAALMQTRLAALLHLNTGKPLPR